MTPVCPTSDRRATRSIHGGGSTVGTCRNSLQGFGGQPGDYLPHQALQANKRWNKPTTQPVQIRPAAIKNERETMAEITKRCPECGKPLKLRTNRDNGGEFLGCTAWPECQHTEKVPEYLRLRAMGAPELPGFGDG